MSEVEKRLRSYFASQKEKARLEYEIQKLKESNNKFLEVKRQLTLVNKDSDVIDSKIKENGEKIIVRLLKINDILEKETSIDFLLSQFEDEDRELLELRYKKNYGFESMACNFHRSKSSISRRNSKLLNIIASNLN